MFNTRRIIANIKVLKKLCTFRGDSVEKVSIAPHGSPIYE